MSPANDSEIMADLLLLTAMKVTIGDAALEGAGLFSLMLLVNPDTSQPWNKRGLLSAADVNAPVANLMN